MSHHPDSDGRIDGTTYPSDRAPEDADDLGETPPRLRDRILARLLGFTLRALPLPEGHVLVVRGEVPGSVRVAAIRALHHGNVGDPVPVFLPLDCKVHVEPRRLKSEDRGYRSTKVTELDEKPRGPLPERGVYTAVPDGRDPE